MTSPDRFNLGVRSLLGSGHTPWSDAEHALRQYELETGEKAPGPLDYLTKEGRGRSAAFLKWYATKKQSLLDQESEGGSA